MNRNALLGALALCSSLAAANVAGLGVDAAHAQSFGNQKTSGVLRFGAEFAQQGGFAGPGADLRKRARTTFPFMPVPPDLYIATVDDAGKDDSSNAVKVAVRLDGDVADPQAWRKTCSGAAAKLLDFIDLIKSKYTHFDAYHDLIWNNAKKLTQSEKDEYVGIFTVYDDLCLENRSTFDQQRLGAIGILKRHDSSKIGDGFCTVFKISDRFVMTALHCLKPPGYGNTGLFRSAKVSFLDSPKQEIDVSISQVEEDNRTAVLHHMGELSRRRQSDYVVLEIPVNSASPANPTIETESLTDRDKIEILAFNRLKYTYLAISKGDNFDWRDAFVWDTQVSCRADLLKKDHQRKNWCFHHGCQSAPGTSGAPVWQNGAIRAHHLGASGIACSHTDMGLIGNVGLEVWKGTGNGYEAGSAETIDAHRRLN